ncbi:MAG TPA: DUF3040 domain-containing protein [Galbitalea sp.]|jgi:hypothetical protein|nr:DUF3040 domain-containing protein [Galbitalea sp.]
MPLSEQEQRLLEEMERSLYHNDADYVAGAGGRHGKPTYGRVVLGVLVGVLGVAVLITGVAVRIPVIGVVGFVAMFVGVLLALTPARSTLSRAPEAPDANATPRPGNTGGQASGGSFLQNLGDKWDNRSDERDE